MKFVRTVTQIRSAIFTNCLLWIKQNSQMSQLICCSKNSVTSQSEQHDIHFILILNKACDFSAVRMQLCSLILSAVWYHLWFDIVDRFDMICSLISFAVWYYEWFDIVYTHSFYFSYLISILSHYNLIALSFYSFMR